MSDILPDKCILRFNSQEGKETLRTLLQVVDFGTSQRSAEDHWLLDGHVSRGYLRVHSGVQAGYNPTHRIVELDGTRIQDYTVIDMEDLV